MPASGLPNGWRKGRLGDLVLLNPDAWEPSPNGTIHYLDIASISGPGRIGALTEIASATAPSRARRKARPGDVLVGTVRPYLKAFVRLSNVPDNLVISTGFAVLRPRNAADSEFVYQQVVTDDFQRHVGPRMTGTGYPAVRPKDVADFPILVPPPEERARIAEVLDSIDAAIEHTEAVISATERLRSALLAELLTRGVPGWHTEWKDVPGIGTIPACWEVVRLGEVAGVRYGLGQPPKESGGDPVPMIRATNIRRGRITTDELLFLGRDGIPASRSAFLEAGEIVVVRSGAYTGDSALISQQWAGAVAGYDLIVSPSPAIDPVLLSQYLLSPFVQKYFDMQRARSAQPHLNSQELSDTPVMLPPRNEQTVISGVLMNTDQRIDAENGVLKHISAVKVAASSAVLSGRLRVPGAVGETRR